MLEMLLPLWRPYCGGPFRLGEYGRKKFEPWNNWCAPQEVAHRPCTFSSDRITLLVSIGVSLAHCFYALTPTFVEMTLRGNKRKNNICLQSWSRMTLARTFIESTLHRIDCKKERHENQMEENKERQPVVVLPYFERISQQIAKLLRKVEI